MQDRCDEIRVLVKPMKGFNNADRDTLIRKAARTVGPDVAVVARDHVVDLDGDVVVADRHHLAPDAVAEGERAFHGVDHEDPVVFVGGEEGVPRGTSPLPPVVLESIVLKSFIVEPLLVYPLALDHSKSINNAKSRQELNTAVRALDRVLRAGFYWIPNWYKGAHSIAYWDKFGRPENKPPFTRGIVGLWWEDKAKAAKLKRQ